MVTRIRQFLAPPVFGEDDEKTRAASLANTILLALIALITAASLVVVLVLKAYALISVIYVSMVLPLVVALVVLRRGHVRAASLTITITLWVVLMVMGYLVGGVMNAGFTTVIIVIIISALLLGGRAGLIVAALSTAAVIFVYISEVRGTLPPALGENDSLSALINHILNYGISSALLFLAMTALTAALQRARRLTAESEGRREQVQLMMQQRAVEAERNVNYLQATTAVARESAVTIGNLQTLLTRVVSIVREQFDFYHVGLYLLDETREWAELRAVSGVGEHLLEQEFRLQVGVEGMIGYVAGRGEYRLAEDVSRDAAYLPHGEFPETRSELVLPLRISNETIGVLDVQSAETHAFAAQDVQSLQALADQIAVAINNARLVEQVRQAAEAERRAYGMQTGEAWQSLLRGSQVSGFYSDSYATAPASSDLWRPEMYTAMQTGSRAHDASETHRLAVPVKVRGEVIGVIDFAKPDEGAVWTAEEITLAEALTEQLGVALDSARLYQDTQRRAARERMTREITDAVQRATDMESLMRIATEELNRALGGAQAYMRLDVGSLTPDGDQRAGEPEDVED